MGAIILSLMLCIIATSSFIIPTKADDPFQPQDELFIFAGGDTTARVYKYWRSNLTKQAESGAGLGDIYRMHEDENYIYSASATTRIVYQHWKSNLTLRDQTATMTGTVIPTCVDSDDTYIYVGTGDGSASDRDVYKFWKSNMSLADESAPYQGIIYDIQVNNDSVYIGGTSPQEIWKIWKSNMSTHIETASLGYNILSLEINYNYVYAGIDEPRIKVFNIDDLTDTTDSVETTSTKPRGMALDDTYVYIGGYPSMVAKKYWLSNLTLAATSSNYTANIQELDIDSDYVYICGNAQTVKKLYKTNLTTVATSGSYGATLRGLCTYYDGGGGGGENASVYQLNGLTSSRITWAGLAGNTVWCNSSGDGNEWMEINMSINSSQNVTEIRILMGDLFNGSNKVTVPNITLYISSDNTSYGSLGAFTGNTTNLTINTSTWNVGSMGANPFSGAGLTNTTKSIWCVYKLTIPVGTPSLLYYSLAVDTCKVYIGYVA